MPRSTFALLVVWVLAGCFPSRRPFGGPSPEGLDPSPFVGCYQGRFHEVEEGRGQIWHFQLYAEAAASEKPGGGRGLPARHATASIREQNDPYWRLIPGGIQLHIGDSLHGVFFDFTATADGLAGRAFYFTDTARGFGTERVSARKVDCVDVSGSAQSHLQ